MEATIFDRQPAIASFPVRAWTEGAGWVYFSAGWNSNRELIVTDSRYLDFPTGYRIDPERVRVRTQINGVWQPV